MSDIQRAIIRHSIEDVIHILEHEPVKGDLVPQITAVQVMNRVSIAHLSIERAFKFLITKAGGPLVETHDLRRRYEELLLYDPGQAKFLEGVFESAVRHYRYNPNAANMTHLQTLERYLEVVGSDRAFEDIRYWELNQSLDEILLRQIYLSIHFELLHGLSRILLAPDELTETVANRVERAVQDAMWSTADMAYGQGTPKEQSVHSYIEWRRRFSTWRDALTDAVQRGFNIGDDFMASVAGNAYRTLLKATDPAVRYFANTLDILPRQPRDVIPCVEWLGPEKERTGAVKTPAGTGLGFIERGLDGIWYVTPLRGGPVAVSANARSQTDARCYLAILLSRPAQVTVDGEGRSLRIVGEGYSLYEQNYDEILRRFEGTGDDNVWTHKVVFWNRDHGIEVNARVRVEVRRGNIQGSVDIVEGSVTEVAEHEVYLSGSEWLDIERQDHGQKRASGTEETNR